MNDQPFINQIIIILVVALAGTNGLTFTMMYIMRNRSDTQKLRVQGDMQRENNHLKVQLAQIQERREKSRSDEIQSDKLTPNVNTLIYMLAKEQDARAKETQANENNYRVLQGLIDRGSKEMQGMVEGLVTKSLNAFKFELQEATASGIAQIAARNVLSDFTKGIKYPVSDDCRWHICMVKLEGKRDVNVWNYPLNMGKVIWKISDTERAYIIAEQYSLIPGWAAVRPVDAPEVEGWVDMHHVTITDCEPQKNVTP